MEVPRSTELPLPTIHFYTFSDVMSGSSRQRAFRVADELRERGVNATIHTPPVLLISRTRWPKKFLLIAASIRSLSSIKKGDIVYLQRTIANKYFFVIIVAYLFIFRRKMIFDIDDPVYVHSFFKTKVLTQMADAVVVSSHAQAEWAKKYNANVHMFHITVRLSEYEKFTKDYAASVGPCSIGWIGSGPEQLPNLEIFARVLTQLLKKTTAPFTFVLVGALKNKRVYDLFRLIPRLQVEFIDSLDWSSRECIPREIQRFDIGVIPNKLEGQWNKGKQSYKLIEYMACGVAVVASGFGEVPYVIQDGENGYLANSEDVWVERLEKLISDPLLRAKIGHAGQDRIRTTYCFEVSIPRLIDLIRSVSQGKV